MIMKQMDIDRCCPGLSVSVHIFLIHSSMCDNECANDEKKLVIVSVG